MILPPFSVPWILCQHLTTSIFQYLGIKPRAYAIQRGSTTISLKALSITTLSIMTLSTTTLSITTLSIMTLSITTLSILSLMECRSAECCVLIVMQSVVVPHGVLQSIGRLITCQTNIKLARKNLPWANTLAYFRPP